MPPGWALSKCGLELRGTENKLGLTISLVSPALARLGFGFLYPSLWVTGDLDSVVKISGG